MRKYKIKNIFLLFLFVFLIFYISLLIKNIPTGLIGYVIFEGEAYNKTAVWDFSALNDYSYDASLLNISNKAELIPIINISTWTEQVITEYNIVSALYDSKDKTSKVSADDNEKLDVDKNKLFNIIFEQELSNNDIISMHLREGDNTNVYLCDYYQSCNAPGYGSVSYDGSDNWFNITISGLIQPTDSFNIDPTNVKFDYITAFHIDVTEHSSTNITYPGSGVIETDDLIINNLDNFNQFNINYGLNGQTIAKEYSLDSGSTWTTVPENGDLSSVSTASGKIRFRITLNSDEINTPVIYNFSLNYKTSCQEDWSCSSWSPGICPLSETQTRTCTDNNQCGTENEKPNETQTCTYTPTCSDNIKNGGETDIDCGGSCNGCEDGKNCSTDNDCINSCNGIICYNVCNENWGASYQDCLINNTKLKYYVDGNNCNTTLNLPADNNTYASCDYCSPSWSCNSYSSCLDNNKKNCTGVIDSNNCYNTTNLNSDLYSGNYSEFSILCSPDNNAPSVSDLTISSRIADIGDIINLGINVSDTNSVSYVYANIMNSNNVYVKNVQLDNISNNSYSGNMDTAGLSQGTYIIDINVSDIVNNKRLYKNKGVIALSSFAKNSFSKNRVNLNKDQETTIDASDSVKALLEITSKEDIINSSISLVQYSDNIYTENPLNVSALNKYIDIVADDNIRNNISSVKIRIYYNETELNNTNLNESTLKMYYYNETSSSWLGLNSTVDKDNDYVEVDLSHLSYYGIFGLEAEEESSSSDESVSDESDGGGGEGGAGITSSAGGKEKQTEAIKETELVKEQEECNYLVDVELPEKISFIENKKYPGSIKNTGECRIDKVELSVSGPIVELVELSPEVLESIDVNEEISFNLIVKKTDDSSKETLPLGFAVKSKVKKIVTYPGSLISIVINNNEVVLKKDFQFEIEIIEYKERFSGVNIFVLGAIVLMVFAIVIFVSRKKEEE